MGISIHQLVSLADAETGKLNHAASTRMQYRWAWNAFVRFCVQRDVVEFSVETVDLYLQDVQAAFDAGQFKAWKYRLLRKTALVLLEVHTTGSYQWKISPGHHPNDGLDGGFRAVQDAFQVWLTTQRLALATQELYATIARQTLTVFQDRGIADIAGVVRTDIPVVLTHLAQRYQPGSMRTVVSAVRVFCRFLEASGHCGPLAAAVPSIFSRRVTTVGVVTAEQVEQITHAPDITTGIGRRNRAMLLLAARTGLRPVDIVGLRLADIDWHHSTITVTQQKTGKVLTVPLLADVGDAIATYLLTDRPKDTAEDHVFLRAQAPFTALSSRHDLYDVSSGAFAKAGVSGPEGTGRGLRTLRSSFASRMLAAKTILPVISGALGHADLESAKHYLSTDEYHLRQCCLDFVGIEPRKANS